MLLSRILGMFFLVVLGLVWWGELDWEIEMHAWLTHARTYSIQTWALEEARRRLEAEGLLPDPDKVNDKQ